MILYSYKATWKLISYLWMYISTKENAFLLFECDDTKAFCLSVEWKLFLMVFSLNFLMWNHGVSILIKLLANYLLVCGCI